VGSLTAADVGEEPNQLYKPKTAEGSLWPQSADKNGLFSDSKASKVGDIVTITISETASATKNANTTASKDSSQAISMSKIFGLGSNMGITDFLGSGNPFDPSLATSNKNNFKGSGATSRSDTLTATMTAVITKILPSGNLEIEGKRMVKVNNEKQTLVLTGVIRPMDIGYNNVISSTLIANAEIQYDGRGVVSDKQRVGWGTRILDFVWPF
jgi:flagellar L-ring protein precursor FlgH